MDHSVSKQNTGKLVGQRNVFLIFSLVLSVAVVLLCTLLLMKGERTVVVPTSGPAFWIEEKRASSGYIEKMGLFVSDLMLNRSPMDVERRNQILMEYVHPSSFHEFNKLLKGEKESVVKNNQSFFFRPLAYQVKGNAFEVEGDFFVMIGKEGQDPFCSQKGRKKFTFGFGCENGKAYLTSMKKEDVI